MNPKTDSKQAVRTASTLPVISGLRLTKQRQEVYHVEIADQARLQALLLDSLGIERVHLMGPSVGGLIALSFACQFPERVRSFISIGSGLASLNKMAVDQAKKRYPEMEVERRM